ncbi:MAG: zinc-binding alcohol dehydrogenase [Erysipelotrichaceae bacterium]|nr:zinc-binding alcohol dehydrogenase [Erysipelotrichaceae bacterium]
MKSDYVELTGVGESHLNSEEIDIKNLNDNEAIIKAEYSMISAGTELSRAFALKQGFRYPVRPGYCMVGKVIFKGKEIDAEVGDRVFVNAPHASLVRWQNGTDVQGPMIIRLPEDFDPIRATAINLLLVAIQGVNLTEVKLGYRVAVFGLGNIGILTALLYKKMGCEVVGLDIVENRCELARTMGVERVISDRDQLQALKEAFPEGIDICVDVTGLANVIVNAAAAVRKYGQVLLLGSPRQSYETDLMPFLSNIHMKDIRIIGAFNQTVSVTPVPGSNDNMLRNFKTACGLLKNDIDITKMITRIIDPKECQQAYYDLMYNKDQTNSIVFDWNNY